VGTLDLFKAILLGIVQGATEFLPVSSSGHLAIIQHWMDLEADSPTMLLFDVLAHVGTLIAVLVVFAKPGLRYFKRLWAESRRAWTGPRYAWRFALLGIAASIPTAIIGLMFKDQFEAAFDNRFSVGGGLLATGVLLWTTSKVPRGRRGWRGFSYGRAVVVGIAQGLAILPGISRSGSTICTATLLGLRRRWAGEFSFFIALPAICGASVIKLKDTSELPADQLAEIPWGPVGVGSIVSLIVGVVALIFLLRVIRRAMLHYFAPYCWAIGAMILVLELLSTAPPVAG
jgi:undecaprenyl-diphosphatase